MEEDLRALLLADAAVTGVCGGRVHWGARPQASSLPALVLYVISKLPDYNLAAPSGVADTRVQADCWGIDYAGAKALQRAVEGVLSGYSGDIGGTHFHGIFQAGARETRDGGEDEAERPFRVSLDFIITHIAQE